MNLGLNQGYITSGFFYQNNSFRFDLGSYGTETGELIGERPSRRYFMRFMWTINGQEATKPTENKPNPEQDTF